MQMSFEWHAHCYANSWLWVSIHTVLVYAFCLCLRLHQPTDKFLVCPWNADSVHSICFRADDNSTVTEDNTAVVRSRFCSPNIAQSLKVLKTSYCVSDWIIKEHILFCQGQRGFGFLSLLSGSYSLSDQLRFREKPLINTSIFPKPCKQTFSPVALFV